MADTRAESMQRRKLDRVAIFIDSLSLTNDSVSVPSIVQNSIIFLADVFLKNFFGFVKQNVFSKILSICFVRIMALRSHEQTFLEFFQNRISKNAKYV